MAHFKLKGREYVFRVTVNTLAVVKDALGIHLMELDVGSPPLSVRLWADPILAASVAYWSLRAQNATTYGAPPATLAEFLELIDPDDVPGITDAIAEGLTDFFQKCRRPDLVALLTQTRATMETAAAHQVEAVAIRAKETNAKMEAQMEKLRTPPKPSSGESSGSPASSPAPARSESCITSPAPASPTIGTAPPS